MRTSFGYPVTDLRWSGFTASGEDLYHCQGPDTYYSSGSLAGQMLLGCRMTGGARGTLVEQRGQHLARHSDVGELQQGGLGSAWVGYMFGPSMGSQEQAVFQAFRAA